FMKLLLRYNFGRANLVTAWAPHMAEAAQKLGAPAERIMILPRGIPYDDFASKRGISPQNNNSASIISTRSLNANYNIDLLLKAVNILRHSGVACSVTLAGD